MSQQDKCVVCRNTVRLKSIRGISLEGKVSDLGYLQGELVRVYQ